MTKCIKHIRDLFEYALYKFTLYLLTYLQPPAMVREITMLHTVKPLIQAGSLIQAVGLSLMF